VLRSEFNPQKTEPIAGPWRAPYDLNILHASVSARNAGSIAGNTATFNVFTCTSSNWELDQLTSDTQTWSMQAATANAPASKERTFSPAISISAGQLFGIEMSAPSVGAMHSLAFALVTQES
jgi:hypothetical protein